MTDREVKKRLVAQRLLEQQARALDDEAPPASRTDRAPPPSRFNYQQIQQQQVYKSRVDRIREGQRQKYAQEQAQRDSQSIRDISFADSVRKGVPPPPNQQIPFSSLRQPRIPPQRPLLQQQQQSIRNPLGVPVFTPSILPLYRSSRNNDDDDNNDDNDVPPLLSRRELSTMPRRSLPGATPLPRRTILPPEKTYPLVEHSLWNDPRMMVRTFAYLYNTIGSLGVQMDAGLWLKVYGDPPYRNRQLNWSSIEDARQMQFVPRYQIKSSAEREQAAIAKYSDYQFYDGSALVASVGNKRPFDFSAAASSVTAAPRAACYEQNNGFFDPPQTTYDRPLRRSFVMQHDGFLCAMHSLNNVMNRVAFAPPDTLGVVDMFRPLGNCYAQMEEVIVAALREGIFLVQIRLTSASDLVPLHDDSDFPLDKSCLKLLKRAGGMLVFQPPGHFVSLVYSNDPEVASAQRWGVFDSRAVVARGPTAATTLDNFIFRRNIAGISDQGAIARELAKRQANQRSDFDSLYIGLLPISLESLLDDQQQDDDNDIDEDDSTSSFERLLEKRLLRSLLRRSLSETMVIKSLFVAQSEVNQQEYEINVPLPLQPSAIDSMMRDIDSNDLSGNEQTNPASLYATRYAVDQALNDIFDEMAQTLLKYFEGGLTRFWRRQLADTLNRAKGTLDTSPGSGLFFTSVAQDENSLRQFLRQHSNRRWFRYFVLYICCHSIVDYIGTKPEIPIPPGTPESRNPRNNPDNDRWTLSTIPQQIIQLLVLLCLVGYTNLISVGNPEERTPHIGRLFEYISNNRERVLLPLAIPAYLAEIAAQPISKESSVKFKAYFNCNRYDKTFWLLEATSLMQLPGIDEPGLPAFPLPTIEPFRLTDDARKRVGAFYTERPTPEFDLEKFYGASCDDTSFQYDDMAEFVVLLRTTLFRLPFAGRNFSDVSATLGGVTPSSPTPVAMAQHMHDVAEEFIARAATPIDGDEMPHIGIDSEDDARRWVDIVAFDRAYSGSNWRSAAQATQLHIVSVRKPRIFERVLQTGFDSVHRTVFGVRTLEADTRRPIYTNQTRIPITDDTNRPVQQWDAVRPFTSQRAQLSTRPIGESSGGIGSNNSSGSSSSNRNPNRNNFLF